MKRITKKLISIILGSNIQIREYSDGGFTIYNTIAKKHIVKNLSTLELANRTRMLFGHSNLVSTKNADIKGSRASGRTIRQVDYAIQAIFLGKTVAVYDHHDNGDHRESSERLFKMILSRLSEEHNLDMMLRFGYLNVNNRNLTFNLTKKYYEAKEMSAILEQRQWDGLDKGMDKDKKDVLRIT